MAFTQEMIDNANITTQLRNNPGGGCGADYTEVCDIIEDPSHPGQPLYWEKDMPDRHQIGIPHPRGTSLVITKMNFRDIGSATKVINFAGFGRVCGWGMIPLNVTVSEIPYVLLYKDSNFLFTGANDAPLQYSMGISLHTPVNKYYPSPVPLYASNIILRGMIGMPPVDFVFYVVVDYNGNHIKHLISGSGETKSYYVTTRAIGLLKRLSFTSERITEASLTGLTVDGSSCISSAVGITLGSWSVVEVNKSVTCDTLIKLAFSNVPDRIEMICEMGATA